MIEFETEVVDERSAVIRPQGRLNLLAAPRLREVVAQSVGQGRPNIVVDLSGTTFIDSSSLGVLIGAHRRISLRRGRLIVVCGNPAIIKTFKITGLDGVFTVVKTLEDAQAADTVSA